MSSQTQLVTVLMPLPLFYNPDAAGNRRPVEDEKLRRTAHEISAHLHEGGILYVFRNDPPAGFWWNRGIVGTDVLALLEVDMADTEENRNWLESYASNVLLERFRQEAIYIKYVAPVERTVVTVREVR